MNALLATCLIVLVALMSRGGLTAPVSSYNSDNSTGPSNATFNNSTATNITIINTNITTLQTAARAEVYPVIQEIRELELYYGEVYNLSHQGCYVRFEPTNNVDVDTLREDVHSITQLVIVIEDLADNEMDVKTLNYYDEMIYGMNRSIVVINNLIAALEGNITNDNSTKVEQNEEMEEVKKEVSKSCIGSHATDSEISPTESTDSPLKSKMDAGTEDLSETDRCMQLPKPVKLSALKLQIELTYEDIKEVYPSQSM